MKKKGKRLDYNRLAEALSERGMIHQDELQLALMDCSNTGVPFPELLLSRSLISDWELSAQVCRLYSMPFLPVDVYPPEPTAVELIDAELVRKHRVIPVQQHNDLLTVCMPALAPAEVLTEIENATSLKVVPMVGTVKTNGDWIAAHLPGNATAVEAGDPPPAAAVPEGLAGPLPGSPPAASEAPPLDDGWDSFFDEADAKVLLDLEDCSEDLEVVSDADADFEVDGLPQEFGPADQGSGGASVELPDISSLKSSVASVGDSEDDEPAS